MGETKNLSNWTASQAPAEALDGSSDESNGLSGTAGSQLSNEGSGSFPSGDPDKIGRYTILGRLGEGGFGRVYRARDNDLARLVAIKVPKLERPTHIEDPEAFLLEAKILANLDHPHIVPVHDVGRTEDGIWFVVSKLVEGSDLAVRMGHARPTFRDSAELAASHCRRIALRPHSWACPPGYQARQHPDRRIGQALYRRFRSGPPRRGLRKRWRTRWHTLLHES